MKKSIYKITAWSVVVSAAVIFKLNDDLHIKPLENKIVSEVASSDGKSNEINDGAYNEFSSNSTNYESSFNTELSKTDGGFEEGNSSNQVDYAQSTAAIPNMGIDKNIERADKSNNSNDNNQAIEENAWAKGGPNNNSNNNTYITSSTTTNITSPNTISGATPASSARVSAPTVVTTPVNPSGSSSGGAGAGDPFVPIDDYYGLIFLIAVSTVVGIFTIKKTRIV